MKPSTPRGVDAKSAIGVEMEEGRGVVHARQEAKRRSAELKSRATLARQAALRLRPKSLPELMVAGQKLQVDLVTKPQLLWLVDAVLACDLVAAPVVMVNKGFWEDLYPRYSTSIEKLSSSEKVRLITHGEQPFYFMPVTNIGSEQHPMVTCCQDAAAMSEFAAGRGPRPD